jgi:hypothetical protein
LIKGSRHAEDQEKKMPTVNIISLKFLIFALDVEPLSDHFLGPGELHPKTKKKQLTNDIQNHHNCSIKKKMKKKTN